MKFTLLDYDIKREQESEYETAVEMSHASISETTIRLRSQAGAVLVLRENSVSIQSSFLEPDLDRFEEDGAVQYQSQSSGEAPKVQRTTQAYLESPAILPVMSEDAWEAYYLMEGSESGEDGAVKMSPQIRQTLRAYANSMDRDLVNVFPAGRFTQDQAATWIDAIPKQFAQGQVVELPVPVSMDILFQEAGEKTLQVEQENTNTRQLNKINESVFQAKQSLNEVTAATRRRFAPR